MDAKKELLEQLQVLIGDTEKVKYIKEMLDQYSIVREPEFSRSNIKKRVDHFLTAKHIDGLSEKTLKEYRCKLQMFANQMNKHISKINSDDIREYLEYLSKERKLKDSSMQTHINTLRSFFSWLNIEDIIKKNPMHKIKSAKIDRRSTRQPLTSEELERLRNACTSYKEKALVEFLVSSGCRLSEVIGININQVNWRERSVVVHGKGGKDRSVYFSVRAKLMLEEYIKQRKGGEGLFVSDRQPSLPLKARAVQRILQALGQKAKGERRVHPHLMRHTFATQAINGGMDITVIQRLLGHTDPKTTLIYAEISPRMVQYEYEKVIA